MRQLLVRSIQFVAIGLIMTLAFTCAARHVVPSDSLVRVEAQIVSAAGTPHGGQFAIIGRETRRVLAEGRTDAMGDIRAVVSIDGRDSGLVLLVQSRGMIGNAYDEWRGNVVPRWPYADAPLADIVVDARSDAALIHVWYDDPVTILDNIGGDSSRSGVTTFGCGPSGDGILDTVAKTASVDGPTLDFGEIRFPCVHAALEIELTLARENGHELCEPVVLGGFEGFPERVGKNKVFPYMALAQRGSRIRILLSRAAARLLFADPEQFLVLRSVASREFESLIVPFPESARLQVRGYPCKVALRATASDDHKRAGNVLRPAPREPALWGIFEPRLRW
jgi:hypothetical protein